MPEAVTETELPPCSSPLLQGERVTFTGTLASMTHDEARRLVTENGGTSTDHASRQTTMLVVGEEGWPLDEDGEPSHDFRNVDDWVRGGLDIQVVRESDFLRLLDLDDRRGDVHRLHTPAMIARLLELPVSAIRRWERLGLIRAVERVNRLPYFDFQEVSAARRLCDLLRGGVKRERLERSLRELGERFPDLDRPLAQLDLLAEDSRLLYRDDAGLIEPRSRQRFFDFDRDDESRFVDAEADGAVTVAFTPEPSANVSDQRAWTATDWFDEGCRLVEENDLEDAIEAFRSCLMQVPDEAEFHRHLAEALYRAGRTEAALERYHVAVEHDHDDVEAWTHIGCLNVERGRRDDALDAFRIALEVHPGYAEAHLFLADALHEAGRSEEAIPHWRVYLQHDDRGPWADRVRRQLESVGADFEPREGTGR